MADATEHKTSAQRFANRAYENKIFIAIVIACILGAWNVVVNTIQQPLVDEHQTFMIKLNAANITNMDSKLDEILGRLP